MRAIRRRLMPIINRAGHFQFTADQALSERLSRVLVFSLTIRMELPLALVAACGESPSRRMVRVARLPID